MSCNHRRLCLLQTYVLESSHKYQQLPLIPVEEFLQQHPEHAEDDETSLMTARINHEHAEREALEQARQGLLKKKQVLIADNKKRKDDLANLDQDLEKFIDVRAFVRTWYRRWLTGCRPPNLFRRRLRRSTDEGSMTVEHSGPKSRDLPDTTTPRSCSMTEVTVLLPPTGDLLKRWDNNFKVSMLPATGFPRSPSSLSP